RTLPEPDMISAGESPAEAGEVRAGLAQAALPDPFNDFDDIFAQRKAEADEFYRDVAPASLGEDHRQIQRQALAGMIWGKQFYHYIIEQWLDGDPGQPTPPPERALGRNNDW